MKKTISLKSIFVSSVLALAMATSLAACGGKATSGDSKNGTAATTASNSSDVSGSITAVGSSALQPLAEKAAQQFMAKNAKAKIQVQGGGSGTGLTQVFQGGANIGNSDIFAEEKLKPEEAKQLVDHKVCVVGFATVVNPNVKVDNLTQEQLIEIFTGKKTNWKDFGGDDKKIVVINRPKSSGTRATFKKEALKGQSEVEGMALTEDSNGTVRKNIAETDGAISYLSLSYVDKTVKALKLNGVEPTKENIAAGKYPIWAYEHMYTKGEPTGLTKAFLDYMGSDEVKKLIGDLGYIPTADMKVSK